MKTTAKLTGSISQKVLNCVRFKKHQIASEIAKRAGIPTATTMLVLRELQDKKLVFKSPTGPTYISLDANLQDELNPNGMFQTTSTDLLLQAVNGELDLLAFAKKELANRGLDASGVWIGFEAAKNLHLK